VLITAAGNLEPHALEGHSWRMAISSCVTALIFAVLRDAGVPVNLIVFQAISRLQCFLSGMKPVLTRAWQTVQFGLLNSCKFLLKHRRIQKRSAVTNSHVLHTGKLPAKMHACIIAVRLLKSKAYYYLWHGGHGDHGSSNLIHHITGQQGSLHAGNRC